MTYLFERQTAVVGDDEIPEEISDEIFATLPSLPSIDGFASRLADIHEALLEAQAEAETLRAEIQQKAGALRALAGALEATI